MLHSSFAAVLVFSMCSVLATWSPFAAASWPDVPEHPLVLGFGVLPQGARAAVAGSADHSTWVVWMDHQCSGSVRLQRIDASGNLLVPGGLVVEQLSGCHNPEILAVARPDGSVVFGWSQATLQRGIVPRLRSYAPDGTALWSSEPDLQFDGQAELLGLFAFTDGDVLVAIRADQLLQLTRLDAEGHARWTNPVVINSSVVSVDMFPDGEGGVMLVWDTHATPTYFRLIRAARINADGALLWPGDYLVVTPNHPFASRHTPHAFTPDGEGGIWVSYTLGSESVDGARPIHVQRIRADGTLAYGEPRRVSLGTALQSAAATWHDGASGDLLVAWRDGGFDVQTLRAQRLSPKGDRLFGAAGVLVRSLTPTMQPNRLTGHWTGQSLLLSVSDPLGVPDNARVQMHRIDATGAVDPNASPLSGPEPAFSLQRVARGDAQKVFWMREIASFQMEPVAQLVQPDGTLGTVPNPSDLNGDGEVDAADLFILLAAWGPCEQCDQCPADLDGSCSVDAADLLVLLANWGS